MDEVDCSKLVPKKYETTRARLIKGDKKRLDQICEKKNLEAEARDGFLKQGVNRCNVSDAIHEAVDCYFEKYELQSTLKQTTLQIDCVEATD